MNVSKEELLHIAKLANLNLKDEELDNYLANLQDILNFANIVNNAPVNGLGETIAANNNCNVFRKDEVVDFEIKKHYFLMHQSKKEICLKFQKLFNRFNFLYRIKIQIYKIKK